MIAARPLKKKLVLTPSIRIFKTRQFGEAAGLGFLVFGSFAKQPIGPQGVIAIG